MRSPRFTARIGHGVSIAEDVSYDELVDRVLEFVVRAAIARANDRSTWEEEELRRQGLKGIEFARASKALWWDADAFAAEQAEAKREGASELFLSRNECGGTFFETLDADLRKRFRNAGYSTASLITEMNEIFREIAADASDRSSQANESLIAEILGT
jgi:hypothetical protein